MSLEPSSNRPSGVQIRHRLLGIYQGSAIDLAFWHPSSGMPEYGLCRFDTEAKAQAYIDFLCSTSCTDPLNPKDLTIEPFDRAQHESLISDNPIPSAWETAP